MMIVSKSRAVLALPCAFVALLAMSPDAEAAELRSARFDLPDGRWEQLTVPGGVEPYTPGRLVGSAPLLAEDYGRTWTTFAYEPAAGDYRSPAVDEPLEAGVGLWIIQRSGADVALDIEVVTPHLSATVSAACPSDEGCVEMLLPEVDAATAWHMLGSPSAEPLDVADVRVVSDRAGTACEAGCDLASADVAKLTDASVYHYDSATGAYVRSAGRGTLRPLQAFWQGVYGQSDRTGVSAVILDPKLASASEIDVVLRTDYGDSSYAAMSAGDAWSVQLGGSTGNGLPPAIADITRALTSAEGFSEPSDAKVAFDDRARPTLLANRAEGSLRLRWFLDGVRVTYDDPRTDESFEVVFPIAEDELAETGGEFFEDPDLGSGLAISDEAASGPVVTAESGLLGTNPLFSTGSIEVRCPVAGGGSVPIPGTEVSLVRRFPYDGPVKAFSVDALETEETAMGRFTYSLFRYGFDRSVDRQAARLRDEIDEIRTAVCGEGVLDAAARRTIAGRLADLAPPNRRANVFTRVTGLFAKGFKLCRLGGAWKLYDLVEDASASETARMEATVYRPPFGSVDTSWVVDLKQPPPYEHVVTLDPELCPITDASGSWQGVLRQRNSRVTADYDYSLQLDMDGAAGTGTARSAWREYPEGFTKVSVEAAATPAGVDFAATGVLEETQRPGYAWCRNAAASLVQSTVNGRSTLRGPLTSDYFGRECGPSTLELEAVE